MPNPTLALAMSNDVLSEEETVCIPYLLCQFTKLSGKIIEEWHFDENNAIKSESKDTRFEFCYWLYTSKNAKSSKHMFEGCIHVPPMSLTFFNE